MKKGKVLLAMSGGVDSSVAAYLLKAEGYYVTGATLRLHSEGDAGGGDGSCCSEKDIADAAHVADMLGMGHFVYNFSGEFKEHVIDRFAGAYMRGDTPNPCIECNRYIKFPKIFEKAGEMGFDYISTGHYARVAYDPGSRRWLLKKGTDGHKDQSYVLYSLTQERLSRTLFPVGELTKAAVREIAGEHDFINSQKPDSQDICFVPDGDYTAFLRRNYGYAGEPGEFTDMDGRPLGRHKGLVKYTTGQRRGLGVSAETPLYVVRKDIEKNTVILGREEDLYSKSLTAAEVNWIAIPQLTAPINAHVKIRYSHGMAPARLIPLNEGRVLVEFDDPQRAVTPGQSAVFYDGDTVIGGGTIEM